MRRFGGVDRDVQIELDELQVSDSGQGRILLLKGTIGEDDAPHDSIDGILDSDIGGGIRADQP